MTTSRESGTTCEVRASGAYRGRFAPSPTGPLHFGSLVAALASCCDARHHRGQWLVRIEDVDLPRSRPGAADAILRALEHHGFAWDGEVVVQSARTELYERAWSSLRARGLVYPCACTRRELEHLPTGPVGERVYPGTCRAGIASDRAGTAAFAWRVRTDVDDAERIAFIDILQGPAAQDLARDVGDFVVRRADGLFAYQLAAVVDDADQCITHVVRGADLLVSTPRQILLQRLLGLATPAYLHVPVALDAAGDKLSKQTRAMALGGNALPALVAAWRFLDQEPHPDPPADTGEFWDWAIPRWSRSRLPPVPMLPAPRAFAALDREPV